MPSGGADCSAWLAFRSVLARIEAQTTEVAPVQVAALLHHDMTWQLAMAPCIHDAMQNCAHSNPGCATGLLICRLENEPILGATHLCMC